MESLNNVQIALPSDFELLRTKVLIFCNISKLTKVSITSTLFQNIKMPSIRKNVTVLAELWCRIDYSLTPIFVKQEHSWIYMYAQNIFRSKILTKVLPFVTAGYTKWYILRPRGCIKPAITMLFEFNGSLAQHLT